MRGGKVLGYSRKVVKEALVGKKKTGTEAVVQTEGMLQAVVGHQEGLPLQRRTHSGQRLITRLMFTLKHDFKCSILGYSSDIAWILSHYWH